MWFAQRGAWRRKIDMEATELVISVTVFAVVMVRWMGDIIRLLNTDGR
jgi:hypothetical protein